MNDLIATSERTPPIATDGLSGNSITLLATPPQTIVTTVIMRSTQAFKGTLESLLSIKSRKSSPIKAVSQGDMTVMRCPLLALPAELREMIFKEVFRGAVVYNGASEKVVKGLRQIMFRGKTNSKEVATVETDGSGGRQRYREPGVLRTCGQIRREALNVYHALLVWAFERRDEHSWYKTFDHLQVFLDRISAAPRRSSHIRVSLPAFVWHDETHTGCVHYQASVECTSGYYQIEANGATYRKRLCVAAPCPPGLNAPLCHDLMMDHVVDQVQSDVKKTEAKMAELGIIPLPGIKLIVEEKRDFRPQW